MRRLIRIRVCRLHVVEGKYLYSSTCISEDAAGFWIQAFKLLLITGEALEVYLDWRRASERREGGLTSGRKTFRKPDGRMGCGVALSGAAWERTFPCWVAPLADGNGTVPYITSGFVIDGANLLPQIFSLLTAALMSHAASTVNTLQSDSTHTHTHKYMCTLTFWLGRAHKQFTHPELSSIPQSFK